MPKHESEMMSSTQDRPDVAIVGAGVAGSALALKLSAAGMSVCVLEKALVPEDKVRGEFLVPWGVMLARELGIRDILERAGGNTTRWAVPYGEGVDPAAARMRRKDLSQILPDVSGALNLEYRVLSKVLGDAAASAGSRILRGVGNISFEPDVRPRLRYEHEGQTRELSPRIVIGADGRNSLIARRAGVRQQRSDPFLYLTGLLVDGLTDWPDDEQTIAVDDGLTFYVFPQGDGKARLYMAHPRLPFMRLPETDKAASMIAHFHRACLPNSFRHAVPIGPCISYTNTAGSSERIAGPGFVLLGDAAGFTDPCGGQGLSCALSDVQMVAAALNSSSHWDDSTFRDYDAYRTERSRRIGFSTDLIGRFRAQSGATGKACRAELAAQIERDPSLGLPFLALQKGPFSVPASAFSDPQRYAFKAAKPPALVG